MPTTAELASGIYIRQRIGLNTALTSLRLTNKKLKKDRYLIFSFLVFALLVILLYMENFLGLLRIHVQRGVNLAIRDVVSSDPYVVIKMGKQKLNTRVMKCNINPEWNEDLTLSVIDPKLPIKIVVYDKDTCSLDDKMGDGEIDIGPFLEAIKMKLKELPNGTIITRIQPTRQNCLAEESCIIWTDDKVVQNICLRLRNVECGELELQLQWIDVPGCRGL